MILNGLWYDDLINMQLHFELRALVHICHYSFLFISTWHTDEAPLHDYQTD